MVKYVNEFNQEELGIDRQAHTYYRATIYLLYRYAVYYTSQLMACTV